jgi:hypothetical protein
LQYLRQFKNKHADVNAAQKRARPLKRLRVGPVRHLAPIGLIAIARDDGLLTS